MSILRVTLDGALRVDQVKTWLRVLDTLGFDVDQRVLVVQEPTQTQASAGRLVSSMDVAMVDESALVPLDRDWDPNPEDDETEPEEAEA